MISILINTTNFLRYVLFLFNSEKLITIALAINRNHLWNKILTTFLGLFIKYYNKLQIY